MLLDGYVTTPSGDVDELHAWVIGASILTGVAAAPRHAVDAGRCTQSHGMCHVVRQRATLVSTQNKRRQPWVSPNTA